MTDSRSRFADHQTYRHESADGRHLELFQPRLRTKVAAARRYVAEGSDRLDLLADRFIGDPHQFWVIADANPDVDLDDLVEPGRDLDIPERP